MSHKLLLHSHPPKAEATATECAIARAGVWCRHAAFVSVLAAAPWGLVGCANAEALPVSASTGPNPTLPKPETSLIPTVNIATAVGWPTATKPQSASGTRVTAFAVGLDHPRWLLTLPNGDVLVAESNAPARPADSKGVKDWVMGAVKKRAGAGVPSADRITLLRDTNADGVADVRSVLLKGLHSPFGMALVGNQLYVANADSVVRFPYVAGATTITAAAVKVVDLPGGPINHHWTKNLIASRDGQKLFVSVGSNSNVAERGMQAEALRAAIWEIDVSSGAHRVFAAGLRNPVGMAWVADRGAGKVDAAPSPAASTVHTLWTVVNERDELGNDLVPDYLTSVKDGAFYGWPYSYFGSNIDVRVQPPQPALVATAVVPDYALGAHTASLGLAWSGGTSLPAQFAHGMFIGQHGSWNRKPHSGYKVVFVSFEGSKPSGAQPIDVLTGFLSADEKAYGRPVGVALDAAGALLVADDVGNVIWRVESVR